MKEKDNWLEILVCCKENVRERIKPYLAKLERQPELGKGAGGDPMKPVDLAAEKAIVDILEQYEVSYTLISEESGVKKFGETPETFYVTVDPVDGTTNLVRGLPFYASSIAVSSAPHLSSVFAGLVADLVHGVTYTACKGKGAFRDAEKITSSKEFSLGDAVLGLDLNTYRAKSVVHELTELIGKTRHIRHFGANALELCYVADGSTEGFIDNRGKLRPTDIAAGLLILREAGGIVTTLAGEEFDVRLDPAEKVKFIASANKHIHRSILSLVKP